MQGRRDRQKQKTDLGKNQPMSLLLHPHMRAAVSLAEGGCPEKKIVREKFIFPEKALPSLDNMLVREKDGWLVGQDFFSSSWVSHDFLFLPGGSKEFLTTSRGGEKEEDEEQTTISRINFSLGAKKPPRTNDRWPQNAFFPFLRDLSNRWFNKFGGRRGLSLLPRPQCLKRAPEGKEEGRCHFSPLLLSSSSQGWFRNYAFLPLPR